MALELKWKLKALMPNYWIMNHHYSAAWDAKLRELMSSGQFEIEDEYTAFIGGVRIWIANHPFASFTPWGQKLPHVRPSRATIAKAHDKLMRDCFGLTDAEEVRELSNLLLMKSEPK